MKKKISFVFLVFLLFCLAPHQAFANNADSPPTGIKLEDIFQVPSGANSSVIPQEGLDVVEITPDSKNQAGAIWNTPNNMMDLTKDFEASMYMYFGDKGAKAADGMAFVMQADKNGNEAFRTGEGARLGVWDSTKAGEWGLAITNSFAVEFDTYFNSDFDEGLNKNYNHIAWNFPGKKEAYLDSGFPFKSRSLVHRDLRYPANSYLSDDQWHPFEVKWNAATQTLTYKFDVLNPVSVPIDVQSVFGTTEVYWGFTGSTGGSFANNRVVFEKVPGLVEGEITEEIMDQEGKSVKNQDTYSGDILTHELKATYLSGKVDWKKVVLNKRLNEHVNFKPGTLRQVNEDGEETFLSDVYFKDNELKYPVGTLSEKNAEKTIRFDVEVNDVEQNTTVTETSVAKGENYTTHTEEFPYNIKKNAAPKIKLTQSGEIISVKQEESFQLKGTWSDRDSQSVSIYYQIDDNEPVLALSEQPNPMLGEENNFSIPIETDLIDSGEHEIKVYAIDDDGAKSNIDKLTLRILGILKLTSLPEYNFGLYDIPSTNKLVFPVTPPKIELSDTRGVGSQWHLKMRLEEPLKNEMGQSMSLVYVDSSNNKNYLNEEDAISIQSGKTSENPLQSIEWGGGKGLSVEVLPSSYVGEYSGKVEWILEDTP
ncbi:hypothetical protein HCA00_03460 [Listeria booriae]|uniref:L-type lectin-domain containing protein n=1 Tax=Listeria booriae TaxID=1552123 RepID=UPI001627ACD7|nr:L-type lectin-domain containing protein [Listeria booriae]MBC1944799.1 hypothetical protein [Listeria booriae]MBC6127845.1 hypothetical protein [Listeria booriae]